MTQPDISNKADIKIFTDLFYQKLATHPLVKDIFFEKLGPQAHWQNHLEVIYNFWESIIFGTTSYKGQSFKPHQDMPIDKTHFDVWLQLLFESVDAHFAGPNVNLLKQKANLFAITFHSKLDYYKNNPEAKNNLI